MEISKQRYETPDIEELKVNAFAVIAGATPKTDEVGGGDEDGSGIEGDLNF